MRPRLLESAKRLPVGRLLLETFLIVVAVLLALAVDEWREKRAQSRLIGAVLETLRVETDRNRQILELRLPYHESIRAALEAGGETYFVESGGRYALRDPEHIPSRADVGIEPDRGLALAPTLSDAAWRAALASGALTSLEYEFFYRLSVAYTTLTEVEETARGVSDALSDFDRAHLERQNPLAEYMSLGGSFEDLVLRERELLELTTGLLQRLRQRRARG